jgi:hypothetical protein
MTELLRSYPITHAGIKPIFHPLLQVQTNSQTAVRYLRFLRPVHLERLELPPSVYGRWVPDVPTHPAHLIISVLNKETLKWEIKRDVDLPSDPRRLGEGLSQDQPIEEMNAHFAKILQDPPVIFELYNLEADHLRVECDREHRVWPNHGECNGGEYNVPFGILNPLTAYGVPAGSVVYPVTYSPLLRRGAFSPAAPRGMRISEAPGGLVFESKWLKVSFSLRRPMLLHLSWDALGESQTQENRLGLNQRNIVHPAGLIGGMSGPLLRTLDGEYGSHLWTGEIEVRNNRVVYRNLTCGQSGLALNIDFSVEPERLLVEVTQVCERALPVVEWEAWRFLWDLRSAMTAAAARPTLSPGRNGDVEWPVLWASDGNGCLSTHLVEGDPAGTRFQIESYRSAYCVTGGAVLAPRPAPDACLVIPAGIRRATIEMEVTNLEPGSGMLEQTPSQPVLPQVLKRHWASVYSCFRPEYGGFSNHAAAVNCHVNHHGPLEIAAFTRPHPSGLFPLELIRFSIERALLDGGGYSYWRNLYLDADPVLVSAAGRIFQVEGDPAWLHRIESGLQKALDRMAATVDKSGLVVCKDLSGNSGSFRWSSNAMDVVGFGHIDGYVNALSYRAFRNAETMETVLGHPERSRLFHNLAEGILANYARQLLNPATGWLAGWRSRDGQLHDYAFLWVNGPAIAFGLLDESQARRALSGLEELRDRVGPGGAEFGIPHNLLPIRADDHMLPQILGGMEPTFERYTDGALGAYTLNHYLRALSIYGFKERARKLVDEFSTGLLAGTVIGGMESGVEFHTWEGLPSGYEGTFGPNFAPLYAIAIELGVIKPLEPEWWPPLVV